MHNGQTIRKAIETLPKQDLYIGVEPLKELCILAERSFEPFKKTHNIEIFCLALDRLPKGVSTKTVTFFRDMSRGNVKQGSSLLGDKKMHLKEEIQVECEDARCFFKRILKPGDEVTLKVDIEGKEYDVMEALLDSELIQRYVKKIYIEWHWHKAPSLSKAKHNVVLTRLNKLGFNLTGHSSKDEFFRGA